jgi:nitroimidazol reductase NimA-like FMN-containing flavoprotein (pyridoxamine 5'-phosphate oxidase superfamily)
MTDPSTDPALQEMARQVLEDNRYLVLGTTEDDGTARVSPVYFTHAGYRTLYWVSSPDAQHSHNLTGTPRVAIVVFDSSRPPAQTEAVYVDATAEQVPDAELATECDVAFAAVGGGARAFEPGELSGTAPLRLYRARVTRLAVHVRGSDPVHGTGTDRRVAVELPLSPD